MSASLGGNGRTTSPRLSIRSYEEFAEGIVSDLETELRLYDPHSRQAVTDSEQLLGLVRQPVVSCVLVLWGRFWWREILRRARTIGLHIVEHPNGLEW